VSADLAHSLSDLLEGPPGQAIWQVDHNVRAMEVDVLAELSRLWSDLAEYLAELLAYFGFNTLMAEEAMLLPGVAEFFTLSAVYDAAQSGDYDLVVVDCGPTADTMRMLGFADSAPERIHKFLRLQRRVVSMLRPFQRGVEVPLPREAALDELGPLADRADLIRRLLIDRNTTSVRLVMNPDSLSIAESRRLFTYLNLFGLPVDSIIVNKRLPFECENGHFAKLLQRQIEHFHEIEKSFPGALASAELSADEVRGLEALREIGKHVYGPTDPLDYFEHQPGMEYLRDETGLRILRLPLPAIDKADLSIKQQGAQVVLKIGAFVRMLTLPDSLANSTIEKARIDQGILTLTFSA
jgi:arsenite-transporting ATPase